MKQERCGTAPTAWIENGNQVYVNEQGERVDTGGMQAYRFPVGKYYNSSGPQHQPGRQTIANL